MHALCYFLISSGELHFEPGDSELTIAVNILDDYFPEDTEYFHVNLKNPKGGAEIGVNGQVTIFISSNDDAHGIVGFAQVCFSLPDSLRLFCGNYVSIAFNPILTTDFLEFLF